ncbi:extracellular solute-binding protein [Maridesulfovibrio sp.]|uniref:extracellular solute-binding protein n=1 Tax=Maridesulfovibrio sp. TaxID=2795000 RepID=UPI002A189F22|nr:extracellular solute-binding protein [Maridesulfovibrio sp.]
MKFSNRNVFLITVLLAFLLTAGSCVAAFAAGLEERVVVYSTHGEAMLEMVADAFEKETGVRVDFINLKGQLGDRVRAEKANPQADVMYGAPSSVYQELMGEGLFAPCKPEWADRINPLFKDSEGYWYGTIQTPVLMFYNSDMLSADKAPKDWSDLANPQYKDMLVFRNALSSSARATYTALLQQYQRKNEMDAGWKFLKGVDANTKRYYGSGSLLFQAIGRKEAAISFAVLNSIIDNKVKNRMPLETIDAASGSPVITDGIALIKGAKHPAAGKAFVEFAGSAKVQAMLANKFNRMPTLPEALKDCPKWMSEIKFKVMDVDWGALAAVQSAWMQKWDSDIKDSSKDGK